MVGPSSAAIEIVLIAGYSAEQLQTVLPRLREALADPQAGLRADPSGERITVTAPQSPTITLSQQAAADLLPAAAREGDEPTYLAALAVSPRYGRWATQFVPLAGMLAEQERPPGWAEIPPEFTELEVIGEGAQRQLRRVRLEDITDAVRRHPALALLGEPGSGKTTTLHRLLLDAARQRLTGQGGPLPVLLPLAEYRDYPSPHAFLLARWAQSLGALDLAAHLRRGDLLLLCDALNEMPFRDSRDYRDRVGAWRQFVKDWPGNRLVFTCRSRDYSEPLGLPQVEIERLDDPRIEDFLTRYLAPAQAQESWARLRGSPLLDLVRNPYYLTMLAYLVARGGAWPASRSGLFQGFTDTLLKREETRGHSDWPGKQPPFAQGREIAPAGFAGIGQVRAAPGETWAARRRCSPLVGRRTGCRLYCRRGRMQLCGGTHRKGFPPTRAEPSRPRPRRQHEPVGRLVDACREPARHLLEWQPECARQASRNPQQLFDRFCEAAISFPPGEA